MMLYAQFTLATKQAHFVLELMSDEIYFFQYGGSIANRCRFLDEVLQAVLQVCTSIFNCTYVLGVNI
jgi:hypothetical protein